MYFEQYTHIDPRIDVLIHHMTMMWSSGALEPNDCAHHERERWQGSWSNKSEMGSAALLCRVDLVFLCVTCTQTTMSFYTQ